MPGWLEGKPFAITFSVLFGIVFIRAQATYWLGRGVTAGALHTPLAGRLTGPKITRAVTAVNRWGPPLVTVSFLTVGFQTVANAAAGLVRMPWIRYTVAMLLGCVAWAAIYATVGIAAVEASLALAAHSPWAMAALLIAVAAMVAAVLTVRRRRRSGAPGDRTADPSQTRTYADNPAAHPASINRQDFP
jgi:membrane protein DedA with SNARE-associated domain